MLGCHFIENGYTHRKFRDHLARCAPRLKDLLLFSFPTSFKSLKCSLKFTMYRFGCLIMYK